MPQAVPYHSIHMQYILAAYDLYLTGIPIGFELLLWMVHFERFISMLHSLFSRSYRMELDSIFTGLCSKATK